MRKGVNVGVKSLYTLSLYPLDWWEWHLVHKKWAVLTEVHGQFTHRSHMEGRVDAHRCRWVGEVVAKPMELLFEGFYFLSY